jgi:hypothetical protein
VEEYGDGGSLMMQQQPKKPSMSKIEQNPPTIGNRAVQFQAVVDENIGIFNSHLEASIAQSPPVAKREPQIIKAEPYIDERKAFFIEDLRSQVTRSQTQT